MSADRYIYDTTHLLNEIDRLRAELAAAETWHMQYVDEANAEYNALADAIARVRELCDTAGWRLASWDDSARQLCDDVLRALGGSTE